MCRPLTAPRAESRWDLQQWHLSAGLIHVGLNSFTRLQRCSAFMSKPSKCVILLTWSRFLARLSGTLAIGLSSLTGLGKGVRSVPFCHVINPLKVLCWPSMANVII